MNPVTASTWIDAKPSEVFALAEKSPDLMSGEVTSVRREPPRSIVSNGETDGRKHTRTMMFEPDRGGTIVTVDLDFGQESFVSRLMSSMSGTAGKAHKALEQVLQELKAQAEDANAAVAGG